MAQKTQAFVQKLYKEMTEISIVVEATMEEQVLNIGEVSKGFQVNIEDLQLQSTQGMPPKVRVGRERTTMTTITNIKKIE
jgi:hypothetical protein